VWSVAWANNGIAVISPGLVNRVATGGLVAVLLCLTVFALWAALSTHEAADLVRRSSSLSDAYQEARFAAGSEESLERDYRLRPSPAVRAKFAAAAASLEVALEAAARDGSAEDRALAARVLADHAYFRAATIELFAAVDAGDQARVLALDELTDPLFSGIEEQVDAAAGEHRQAALEHLARLSQVEQVVSIGTPVVFLVGLLLLGMFWAGLRAAQRRTEAERARLLRERLEHARSEAEKLRRLDRVKDELVSVVSHELRTPLTSVVGFAELLLTRELPEADRRTYLRIMLREGVRLTALIDDLLDLKRLESGAHPIAPAPIELRALLEQAAAVYGGDAHHPLHLEMPRNLPAVRADGERIQQVLGNLLSNAVKYSPAGGPVRLSASETGGLVEVAVQDWGLGIPPEELPRLFRKFYRVDSPDRHVIGGTGLGLAICRNIVEAHVGRIWAQSAGLGRGATFRFTLPVALMMADAPSAGRTAPEALTV
jgi:signal transduction histidine kinase